MSNSTSKEPFQRLPKVVIPKNYKLKISTDFSTLTFKGEEEIDIVVTEAISSIILNSLNLKVTDVIFHHDQTKLSAISVIDSKDDSLLTLQFSDILPLGDSKLTLNFEGALANNMKGFYLSKYKDSNGIEHLGASTQFQPTDARRAFPCWDEPAIKASFDITLIAPKNKVVLSNMNLIEKQEHQSTDSYTFARTPIMSTYIVAYVIGDYDCITRDIENGLKISIYAPVGKSSMGKFALEAACKTIPFYTKYFNVPYPLNKLDLIAIPDFSLGAMENWGLITYREMALLVDEKSSAQATQYVALVVGHELAHQWFGNLVTMEWWTHLWLNEGFATWIEYLSVDHCFPHFNVWKSFATADYADALELDGLRSSHPIEVAVGHPSEIDEIFDAISYSKGACIIRMLFDYIGQEAFSGGLSKYLKHFAYKNTETADLWKFLGQSSNSDVDKIMSTWTSQIGYPIISVSQKKAKDGIEVMLSQERFISDGNKSHEKAKWIIPISIASSDNPNKPIRFLLENESGSVFIPFSTPPKWIKLNYGQIGFYRVKYPDEMFTPLISHLGHFTTEERLGFLNDVFALARSGSLQTTKYLDLLINIHEERDSIVWEEIYNSTMAIMNLIYYSKESKVNVDKFKKIIHTLLNPVYMYVGYDKESSKANQETHEILLLRSIVVGILVKSGNLEVISKLKSLCEQHISGKISVAPDICSAMFYSMLSSNEESDFNKLIEYYKKSNETEEKLRILKSMSALQKIELINKALDLSLSNIVRLQDCHVVFSSISSNPAARLLVWQFLKNKWNDIYKRYEGGPLVYRIVKEVISGFADQLIHTDIKNFFETNPCGGAARSLQQGLESIINNQIWLKRDEQSITEWLAKH